MHIVRELSTVVPDVNSLAFVESQSILYVSRSVLIDTYLIQSTQIIQQNSIQLPIMQQFKFIQLSSDMQYAYVAIYTNNRSQIYKLVEKPQLIMDIDQEIQQFIIHENKIYYITAKNQFFVYKDTSIQLKQVCQGAYLAKTTREILLVEDNQLIFLGKNGGALQFQEKIHQILELNNQIYILMGNQIRKVSLQTNESILNTDKLQISRILNVQNTLYVFAGEKFYSYDQQNKKLAAKALTRKVPVQMFPVDDMVLIISNLSELQVMNVTKNETIKTASIGSFDIQSPKFSSGSFLNFDPTTKVLKLTELKTGLSKRFESRGRSGIEGNYLYQITSDLIVIMDTSELMSAYEIQTKNTDIVQLKLLKDFTLVVVCVKQLDIELYMITDGQVSEPKHYLSDSEILKVALGDDYCYVLTTESLFYFEFATSELRPICKFNYKVQCMCSYKKVLCALTGDKLILFNNKRIIDLLQLSTNIIDVTSIDKQRIAILSEQKVQILDFIERRIVNERQLLNHGKLMQVCVGEKGLNVLSETGLIMLNIE
ncbi:Hypothetical_protein [Hexamita inflata]|uniref:Hypothetical_protein n=1 Tax=Hexamita inflata TaxID=28002 RepID=A0ABP1I8R2_9EUKA